MKLVAFVVFAVLATATATVHFKETFDADWQSRWVLSDWKGSEAGKWDVSAGEWYGDKEEDKGLRTTQDARFYDIASKIPKPFSNEGKDLVIQFQVRFPQKIDCGGGYLKILGSGVDLKKFAGDTQYNIMFGPDICGTSTKRVHVIFRHPTSNENLLIKKEVRAETDQLSHVYTLIVHPDNTYEVLVDGDKRESGSLYADWDIEKPKRIPDPSAKKPADWVDSPKMDDPTDTKPANWDDVPKEVPDPNAERPNDWDDDADGTWEAPTIPNPDYKGEWKPRQIDNPAYKGPWKAPEIDNPDYVAVPDAYKYSDFGAVGIDIWQVKSGTIFDNIIITDSVQEAADFRDQTWKKNKDAEKKMFDDAEAEKRKKEDEERKKVEEQRKKQDEEKAKDKGDDDDEDDDDDDKVQKKNAELHDDL